ncbi:sensor histidine kinase [Gaoshiqia sediminis]|uniref:Histidine kinase n=1 Tax=Gaoshiqia sediminis TaxID=2986998 RepID=A0AA42C518_9BACT|nr:histidine kinase [Gaoshiqia sediminis]MCW0482358.1 histidine kinase [Gaoshiqia sediminis]
MNFTFLSNKKLTVVLHAMAWLIIVIIPRYLVSAFGSGQGGGFLYQFYANTAIYGAIFYLNYLWIVPKFFFRESKLRYFLYAAGGIVALFLVSWILNEYLFHFPEHEEQIERIMKELANGKEVDRPPFRQFRIFNYFYTAVLISGFSLGLGVLEKLGQNEKQRKELEKEKLNSELAFLKNQVSPHFFFNTLNNIYSLIGIDTGEAQDAVLKLSKLMRYLLYESEQSLSRLSDEIAFMHNYIDLMKLRLSKKVELSVSLPEKVEDIFVPPLLFIPFVENAFKHGVSYRENSFIEISMKVEGSSVSFFARNSIGASSQAGDGQHSGIGLDNVKKRLDLLFPNQHVLHIVKTDSDFRVELKLETKNLNA